MKKLLILIFGSLFMTTIHNANSTEFTVEVTDIDHTRGGDVIVYIFEKEGFPKKHDKAILTQTKAADSNSLTFNFVIEPEEIAVKVLHDEDRNGKVTKNWTGVYPKEGLGFTNKQKVTFTGPPKYKKSKVSKKEFEKGLTISVIYP